MYTFRYIRGHIEVYKGNEFILSADTKAEALRELQELED